MYNRILKFLKKPSVYRIILGPIKKIREKHRNARKKRSFFRKIVLFMTGKHDMELTAKRSVIQYCIESDIPARRFLKRHEEKIFEAQYYWGGMQALEYSPLVHFTSIPEIYCAEIKDPIIIGQNDGMIVNKSEYLNDKFCLPESQNMRFDLDTEAVLAMNEGKIVFGGIPNTVKTIECGIFMLGVTAQNYYHFVYDIMSRIVYINQCEQYKNIPLLLDKVLKGHPTYLEFLGYVDRYKHPVIYIGRSDYISVKKLIWFSPCTFSSVYWKEDCELKIERFVKLDYMIQEYRRIILERTKEIVKNKHANNKIFLIRGEDKPKRLVNEHEAAKLSETYGFELIDPEKYSILEQAAIFHFADIIISDEGAALVNSIYMHKAAIMVSIMPEKWRNCQFTNLAFHVGARCINLDASLVDAARRTHYIDLNYLEDFLKRISSL